MDVVDDTLEQDPTTPVVTEGKPPVAESDKALVKKILKTVAEDKAHHDKAFKQMKRDMYVAKYGRLPGSSVTFYTANIAGRHVKQKTAGLYAKNPKATARRRETLDFELWDENPDTLKLAFMTVQQAAALQQQVMMAAAAAPMIDPRTGLPVQPEVPSPPGLEEAQALLADFQQGMERRTQIAKTGRTLEILFGQALREQKPIDFKTGMKKLVRRACTTAVGYVELGFQRETGPRPGLAEQLADARARLDRIQHLSDEVTDGEIESDDAEMAELEHSIAALQTELEIVLREGLVIDFPASTKVIPDKLCKSLVGFVGARHLTLEYMFTKDEVKELFGVELKKYAGYAADDKSGGIVAQASKKSTDDGDVMEMSEYGPTDDDKSDGLVCVYKHFDKPSGLVYFVAEGHEDFLRAPAAPDVFVEDFWPVYALTFNDVEMEDELFPPSDVALMLAMQLEHNRSRQGKREHRQAARPRWAFPKGTLDDEDIRTIENVKAFQAVGLNKDPQTKLSDILEVFPVPGVDPNLYDTNESFADIQLVVGTQQAQLGGIAKATATESAISANSSATSDGSSVDDLDAFLTLVARASGQILLKEMSEEQVKAIVGPGAVWPHMSLSEIADEIYLEVEAGSTGKPNQAIEINNWKTMLPFLLQMPAVNHNFLAKETFRRLDDRMDLTDAISPGIPSIVAQNQNQQPGPTDPGADPNAQGGEGAANAPAPPGETGSGPAFGSNQV